MSWLGGSLSSIMKRANENAAAQAKAKEEARIAALKAQGKNADGSPVDVQYKTKLNADGTLMDQYKLANPEAITVDQRAQNEIRNRALSQGPSTWAQLATQQQGLEEQDQLGLAQKQAASQNSAMLNKLMMTGGVSGGARTRLAAQGNRDALMAQQGVRRQGLMDRMKIGQTDDEIKRQMLGQTTDLDFKNANLAGQNRDFAAQIADKNIGRTFEEQAQQRQFDIEQFKSKMAAWGAEKTADAQRAAAGSARGGKK